MINLKTKKEVPKIIYSRTENGKGKFDFWVLERKMQIPSNDLYLIHMLFGAFHGMPRK